MDFRAHQDRAKKNSRIIWLLYILLLILSSFFVGWALSVGLIVSELYSPAYSNYGFTDKFLFANEAIFFGEELFTMIAISSMTIIVQIIATSVGFFQKSNGHKVAKAFGGKIITNDTATTFDEKQALNIVSEQALAASISTPTLYIIPENGINAFAAGKTIDTAVVALTHGALKNFNRTELSGVVAHEIGHIVNQDIKLNIQISAFVFGFTALFFIARFIFYSSLRGRVRDARAKIIMFVIAAVIAIIGALTVWMGRVLQAAMSRQREFLADASAVQFTRYPQGLVQAFEILKSGKKSTKVENPTAHEYAHAMMFSIGTELFATHPPIDERIARVKGVIST